jgi:hypothetical protein
VTAPSIFNADFTGTALEYKVAPYTATVYLDKGKVARGVVLDVASVYDLGGEEYSTAPLDPSEGPAAYLAHLGLPMPVETPEGGNLSDRPAGDFKTLQWKHTADGYWIYIRALRSGRITGLNAWKLGGVAATQVVQVPPTTTNLAKKPTTAPTAKPLAAKPTNGPAKPSGLKYDPNGPDRNCSDFDTYQEALAFYRAAGGPARDPHGLDNDHDGIPCENLPSAP